jgi:hypothetical protein
MVQQQLLLLIHSPIHPLTHSSSYVVSQQTFVAILKRYVASHLGRGQIKGVTKAKLSERGSSGVQSSRYKLSCKESEQLWKTLYYIGGSYA